MENKMSYIKVMSLCAVAFSLIVPVSLSGPAMAQDREVTNTVRCESFGGSRQVCSVEGIIQYAGISQPLTAVPCTYGLNWGFAENGIWVGGGCGANFEITSVVQEQTVDPDKLEKRVKRLQKRNKKLLEELAEVKDLPGVVLNILTCAKAAAERVQDSRINEVYSASFSKGKWTVIGSLASGRGANRRTSDFVCQTEKRKVIKLLAL